MRITKFRVQNYKGISDATLVLGNKPGTVHTLIGLNESGKTTLLEAINLFRPDLKGVQALAQDESNYLANSRFIPRNAEVNFTGAVSITATVQLNDADILALCTLCTEAFGFDLDRAEISKPFNVEKRYEFEAAIFNNAVTLWGIPLVSTDGSDFEGANWKAVINFIGVRLPNIVYFPNFLFDVPDAVDLTNQNSQTIDARYKLVIDNVLSCIEPDLTLDDHVILPTLEMADGKTFTEFEQEYNSSTLKRRNSATLSKISSAISQIVFKQWQKIQPGAPKDMEFKVELEISPSLQETNLQSLASHVAPHHIGAAAGNQITVAKSKPIIKCRFQLRDGHTNYELKDRSVGFRWFFCFFLFTFFHRKSVQSSSTIFLLDEPASNLHAGAQKRILDSFSAIANSSNDVVYSTHSHYLINPLWLENAHIVANRANAKEEELGDFSFTNEQTNIEVQKYKSFVGQHANDTLYFLPVLDALDYSHSQLELVKDAVILEGKSDYYVFAWFKKHHFPDFPYEFIPGGGAGNVRPIAALLLGWGKTFAFLHDSDKAGNEEAAKLLKSLPIPEHLVFGFADILSDNKKSYLENLLSKEMRANLAKRYSAKTFKKGFVIQAFSESLNGVNELTVDHETLQNFKVLFEELQEKMSANR